MELKLNIYNKKRIVKTHVTNDVFLELGVCADVLKIIDIDKFSNMKSQTELVKEVMKIVIKCFSSFEEILLNLFDDLTADELRHTRVDEVAMLAVQIVGFTIDKLNGIPGNQKN